MKRAQGRGTSVSPPSDCQAKSWEAPCPATCFSHGTRWIQISDSTGICPTFSKMWVGRNGILFHGFTGADAREHEDRPHPGLGSGEDVGIHAVADHERVGRVGIELAERGPHHQRIGLADEVGLSPVASSIGATRAPQAG